MTKIDVGDLASLGYVEEFFKAYFVRIMHSWKGKMTALLNQHCSSQRLWKADAISTNTGTCGSKVTKVLSGRRDT
jgi:hypothetical protein